MSVRAGLRGVVFDKDGTLFDFHATWRAVVEDALAAFAPGDVALRARLGAAIGYDYPGRRFAPGSPVVAGATSEVARRMAELLPPQSAAIIEAHLNARAAAASGDGLVAAAEDLPGLLDRLRAAGLALGVATHDSEAAARAQLASVGVLDRFGFVAGYDSGHGLKPGAGMIAAFCGAAELAPGEVAVVGDSVHDLMAGAAAGVGLRVAVLTGPADAAALAPHADLVLESIERLPAALGL